MADEQGYIEFFYQYSSTHPAISIRLAPDSDLTQLFESFEGFLRAAGYHFDGTIEIVQAEEQVSDEAQFS